MCPFEADCPSPTGAVALAPEDWFWAPWRRLPPLPRPEPRPFDPADGAARLALAKRGRREKPPDWKRATIAPGLTEGEARFWLDAMLPQGRRLGGRVGRGALLERARANRQALRPEVVLPLAHFLPPEECVGLLLGDELVEGGEPLEARFVRAVLRDGFRRYLLPYLDSAQAEGVRWLVARQLRRERWPTDERPVPVAFSLAAALGMHAELLPLVEGWPDHAGRRRFVFQTNERQNVVLGLASPGQVRHHLTRLGLRPLQPEHARAWLAHFGLGALGPLRAAALALPRKERAARVAEALCLVRAPEAAPHV